MFASLRLPTIFRFARCRINSLTNRELFPSSINTRNFSLFANRMRLIPLLRNKFYKKKFFCDYGFSITPRSRLPSPVPDYSPPFRSREDRRWNRVPTKFSDPSSRSSRLSMYLLCLTELWIVNIFGNSTRGFSFRKFVQVLSRGKGVLVGDGELKELFCTLKV